MVLAAIVQHQLYFGIWFKVLLFLFLSQQWFNLLSFCQLELAWLEGFL